MRFSVVIPLYNKAPYVAKAIQSVLAQTFTDYELIVVDDGSKDESFSVALKSIEGYGNCRIYKQKNGGVSVARNRGVQLSQGGYLCFLDADDWWEPTFLEEMSKLIEEYPEAGIYGTNYTIVNEAKHKTRVAPVAVESGFERGYINYCQVYAKCLAMPLWTGAVCIPRSVFDETEGFPQGIKLGEDFLLWIRIALKHKVVFLNKALAYYNQDVEAANRGVGRLHKPEEHMLWNLAELEPLEQTDPGYKQLVDNLRTYSLLPYYLSATYRDYAQRELDKVDWERQPFSTWYCYHQPMWMLRCASKLKNTGSKLKQRIRSKYNLVE